MQTLIPGIETAQLILRPLLPSDAEALYRINQAEGVLRYFPDPTPPPLEKVERFVAAQQKHWEQRGYGNWGIVPKGQSEIAGWAGLWYIPELDETEVGYLLDPRWWGRGIATEAALASLQFGFERFGFDHIIALVHPENLASRRVLEKCGMHYTDTIFLWGVDLMRHRLQSPQTTSGG